LTVDDDRVDFELPISLTSDGDVGEFADVMVGVRTAQGHLAALFTALSTAVSVHPKSENRFGAFAVLDQTSERRGDIFDRDTIVAQTHDTVEFGVDESGAGFGAAFGETLIVDANAAFFATEANFVRLDDALHRAGTVTNGHSFRRRFASAGRSTLKFLSLQASRTGAIGAWDPSVRRTGIEKDLEALRRSADRNLTIVLSVLVIFQVGFVHASVGSQRLFQVAGKGDVGVLLQFGVILEAVEFDHFSKSRLAFDEWKSIQGRSRRQAKNSQRKQYGHFHFLFSLDCQTPNVNSC